VFGAVLIREMEANVIVGRLGLPWPDAASGSIDNRDQGFSRGRLLRVSRSGLGPENNFLASSPDAKSLTTFAFQEIGTQADRASPTGTA